MLQVQNWIKTVVLEKTGSQDVADHAGGTIRTFGSFRLGVNAKSGDIDCLIVAPRQVTRSVDSEHPAPIAKLLLLVQTFHDLSTDSLLAAHTYAAMIFSTRSSLFCKRTPMRRK